MNVSRMINQIEFRNGEYYITTTSPVLNSYARSDRSGHIVYQSKIKEKLSEEFSDETPSIDPDELFSVLDSSSAHEVLQS